MKSTRVVVITLVLAFVASFAHTASAQVARPSGKRPTAAAPVTPPATTAAKTPAEPPKTEASKAAAKVTELTILTDSLPGITAGDAAKMVELHIAGGKPPYKCIDVNQGDGSVIDKIEDCKLTYSAEKDWKGEYKATVNVTDAEDAEVEKEFTIKVAPHVTNLDDVLVSAERAANRIIPIPPIAADITRVVMNTIITTDPSMPGNKNVNVANALAATYWSGKAMRQEIQNLRNTLDRLVYMLLTVFAVSMLGGLFMLYRRRNVTVSRVTRVVPVVLLVLGIGLLAGNASAQTRANNRVVSVAPDAVGQDYSTPDKQVQRITLAAPVKGDVVVSFSDVSDDTNADVAGIAFTDSKLKGNALEGQLTVDANVPVGTYKVWVNDQDGNDLASGGELYVFSSDMQLLGYYIQQHQSGADLRKQVESNTRLVNGLIQRATRFTQWIDETDAKVANRPTKDEVAAQISNGVKPVEGRVTAVEGRVTAVEGRVTAVERVTAEQFAKISTAINALNVNDKAIEGAVVELASSGVKKGIFSKKEALNADLAKRVQAAIDAAAVAVDKPQQ